MIFNESENYFWCLETNMLQTSGGSPLWWILNVFDFWEELNHKPKISLKNSQFVDVEQLLLYQKLCSKKVFSHF